jgi:hypothetical protein
MDYRFAIRCWQDQAGDENAKLNVWVNGSQVITEQEITATNSDSPQFVIWESTGLPDIADDASVTIKVAMATDYYLDASTDRNIHINGIGYIDKADGTNYKHNKVTLAQANDGIINLQTITDFTDWSNYVNSNNPTDISSSVDRSWWATEAAPKNAFYTITLWGNEDDGVTITQPLTRRAIHDNSD